jgi:threonine synthase
VLTGHTLKDPEYTIQFHRGELLTAAEMAGEADAERLARAKLQHEPLVLEADVEAVLRALEQKTAVAPA